MGAGLLLLGLGLSGCHGRTFDDAASLREYVQNDEAAFVRSLERGNWKIRLRYMPVEALMVSEFEEAEALVASTTRPRSIVEDSLRAVLSAEAERYGSLLRFVMDIDPVDGRQDLVYGSLEQGRAAYQQWLDRLLFGLQESITLEADGIEIPLSSYHMERTYGQRHGRSFFLAFPAEVDGMHVLDGDQLGLRIQEFGLGIGHLNFTFDLPYPVVHYRLLDHNA